jgi:hypothetical protein
MQDVLKQLNDRNPSDVRILDERALRRFDAHRDFARERLDCCLALISTGLTVDSDEQASAISNRLRQTLCYADFMIGRSRTLDFSDVE